MASALQMEVGSEFVLDVPATLSIPPNLDELVKEKNLDRLRQFGGTAGVVSALASNTNDGIIGSEEDVARRKQEFGSNTYNEPPKKSFFHFVVEAFKNLTILILLGCAGSGLYFGFGIKEHGLRDSWYDGGCMSAATLLVIAVSAVSKYKQNRQFDNLSEVDNNIQVEVIREGRLRQISIFDIVVGDVIRLKIGDQIPADGLFIQGHSLQVDESGMTGESNPVEVNGGHNPFLLSGTKVVDGYATMLATSVGMNTIWGQKMSQTSSDANEETPTQARLNTLTLWTIMVAFAVAFVVLVVLLARYFTGKPTDVVRRRKAEATVVNVLRIVAASVTTVVVAIPKVLPLAIKLSTISYSKRMADQAMVRNLSACETIGFATVICTDTTGTLTQNQMRVTKFLLGKEPVDDASSISPSLVELIQQGVAVTTTVSVYRTSSGSKFAFSGSPTEKAILFWAVQELNMNMEDLRQSCTFLKVEAFDSQNKGCRVLMRKNTDNTNHVHWTGEAEMILASCSSYYDASGIRKDLDDDERERFKQIIRDMAGWTLKCIGFAHKQVSEEENDPERLPEDKLRLLGLVGIHDPFRPEIKQAVKDSHGAGVDIKMITDDNLFTAKAIAADCGILTPNQYLSNGAVIEAQEFRNYTPETRKERVDDISVMAKATPHDKLLMVQCLKDKGYVVAVTGNSTNDAPALKEADIGLCMGIQGTKEAKKSSDIIILDDNFASVVTVLKWGRCVYSNISKFIKFQLTVNVAAFVISFVTAVLAGEVPLTAVQLLWINIIMDTLGVVAVTTQLPTKKLMSEPPAARSQSLITSTIWWDLLLQATYLIAILLILQFKGEEIFHIDTKGKNTMVFNTFVLCQVLNEFKSKKHEEETVPQCIRRNKLFLLIIGIIIVVQVAMVEFLNKFANTERLGWSEWGTCILIAAASWTILELVSMISMTKSPSDDSTAK